MSRIDSRASDELRPVHMVLGYQSFAGGSVLIEQGKTRVLCSVSMEERVPGFLRGSGQGWLTAEYAMLPRATLTRTARDRASGRSEEIQRLIGRSLRASVNLAALGEMTFIVDCDVLQADGGTRTASITGAYVALYQAFHNLRKRGVLPFNPLGKMVAAVSVGLVDGTALLDLCYEEDYRADVDFNIVMTDNNEFVEVQGTAEGKSFSRDELAALIALAQDGIGRLFQIQKTALRALT